MRGRSTRTAAAIFVALAGCLLDCDSDTTPPASQKQSLYALEYVLLDAYPQFFYCDPDYYPVGSVGGEELNAIEQFSTIRANPAEFTAILQRLKLPLGADYTDEEKLSIYREHKKLTFVIWMTPTAAGYDFQLAASGFRIEGSISFAGTIEESKREEYVVDCPVCLTRGTRIDTPAGPVPVEEIGIGDHVWTLDENDERVVAAVIENTARPVPPTFKVVEVTLADGRTLAASAGHPTADGRRLGDCKVGERLDGSPVLSIASVRYSGGSTYDILPAGPTGLYWANHVRLRSTLVRSMRSESGAGAAANRERGK